MITELGRLPAVDGSTLTVDVPADAATLIVQNGLAAVLLGRWSGQKPTAGVYDFAVPGESYLSLPMLAGVSRVTFLIVYPGAVPAADVQAIAWWSSCNFPPFVGPLA